MKTNFFRIVFIGVCVVASCLTVSWAQEVTGATIQLGGRQFNGNLGSSKFTEYRDLPAGLFVNAFSLSMMNSDNVNAFSLWGSNVGQRDQNVNLQFSMRGKLKLEFEWDQLPHNYTNTARTVFSGAGTGTLLMPELVRNKIRAILTTDLNPNLAGVQFDTSAITGLILGSARGVDVVSQRDKGKAALTYSPTNELDFKLQYSNERRSGTKPYAGTFSFNPNELLEPTEYRTQDIMASAEYAVKNWDLQLAYSTSIFKNNIDVLVWDNPFREVDAVGAASRGRIDLWPDNMAQQVKFSGAGNLPLSTRIMTSFSYGWRSQNDAFIPYTINSALTSVPALPATSLNGKVGTTLATVSFTNRYFSSVWFSAKYRFFDYDNQTPSLIFPGYVSTDNSVGTVQRRNAVIGHKKINASFDATLRMVNDLALKLGYERENWDREQRDAEKTEENIYKASLDYTPRSWFLLRTSYSFGAKKTPQYDAEEVAAIAFPLGEPAGSLGQLPQLRKFDLASRDRQKASILAQVTPLDMVTLTGSFGLANDDFKESLYGLLWNKSNNVSIDLSCSPTYDLTFFANYTRENFKYEMKSRQRTSTNDLPVNDWSSNLQDDVHTFGFGVSWAVDPEKIDLSLDFNLADAKGTIATSALGDPADPKFLVTTAQNYPDTRSILRQLRASLVYKLTEHFRPRLEYRFEGYTESLFNQDFIEPYMYPVDTGASGAVFLGARAPGYSAHMLYLVLTYSF